MSVAPEMGGIDTSVGVEELESFEALQRMAGSTEKVVDPRMGRHDDATFMGAAAVQGESGKLWVGVTWANLTDSAGEMFEFVDRVFLPVPEDLAFQKLRFMECLKALEVIPNKYDQAMYFPELKDAQALAAYMTKVAGGQQFTITLTMSTGGFVNCRVRRRPRSK